MRIRLFIAILALVLCAIAVRANRPIVIKDSEAIQYVGKEVEVQGCVVCVMTSPLGTTFINFGGEYPNQTFAGFIAAVSRIATDQRLTMIQGKIISITGTIQLRDGKPEIEIVSPDQIKVLGSQTEAKHSINFSPQTLGTRLNYFGTKAFSVHELSQFSNRISRRWKISFFMSLTSVNWPQRVTSQLLGWPSNRREVDRA